MDIEEIIDVKKFKFYLSHTSKYFRINTLKITEKEFSEVSSLNFSSTPISFIKKLEEEISLGSTSEYFLGLIHPQTISSSLPALLLEPKNNEIILDATASPGSKTTQIAMHMQNTGIIVANDRADRLTPLFHNIARLGVVNTVVVSKDAKKPIASNYFDKALLDAPCSALGSHLNAWKRFKQDIAKSLSRVQKRMILSAFDSLKEGGILVYSTCTITEEENESVVSFLLENRDAELLTPSISLPHDSGLSDYGSEFRKVVRVYPWHINSEGFFIAKIRKKG